MNYPLEIATYLVKNTNAIKSINTLVVDTQGILKSIGNSSDVFNHPLVGESIERYLSCFVGIFPVEKNLYLPNIQLSDGKYFNIHLYLLNNEVWVIFDDVTPKIDDLNQHLLIHPVSSEFASELNIVQSSRDNSIVYDQLIKTKKELQDLLILKDKFVSIVSHDFRSPLSSIYEGIDYLNGELISKKNVDDEHVEILGYVKKEIARLLEYNNKLYGWIKMNLENLEVNVNEVDLVLLLSEIVQYFDNRLKEKQQELDIVINEKLLLETDYELLNQALSNIIDNAIKFSPEESKIRIELNTEHLIIKDDGVGMPKTKIEDILKGHSIKSTTGTNGEVGTGLGLNVVTRILEVLDFKLEINSNLDKGTTFIISLQNQNNHE